MLGGEGGFDYNDKGEIVNRDPKVIEELTKFAEAHWHWYNEILAYIKEIGAKLKGLYYKITGKDAKQQSESQELDEIYRRLVQLKATVNTKKAAQAEGQYMNYGPRAKTANISRLINAKEEFANGADREAIRQKTGWIIGDDGKWRFRIADDKMTVNTDLFRQKELTLKQANGMRLSHEEAVELQNINKVLRGANTENLDLDKLIVHDELFAAYPELRGVKVSFKQFKGETKGEYLFNTNEINLSEELLKDADELKSVLVHEIQHAIQYIEGFAKGGDIGLALICIFNSAYEEAKNAGTVKSDAPFTKVEEIWKEAIKTNNATSLEELAFEFYQQLHGEVEARSSSELMEYDQKMLDKIEYNVSGVVVDYQQELNKFVANLMEIGYTEQKAKIILEELLNDQSGSVGSYNQTLERDLWGNRQHQHSSISKSNRGTVEISPNGKGTPRNDGRRVSPSVATRTGEYGRGELNTDYQKADSEQEPAFSMPKQDGQAYVSPSRHNDLHEQYKAGKITLEQYQAEIKSRERAQATEIRKLRQQKKNQQDAHQQLQERFKHEHGGWSENKALEVLRGILKEYPTKVAATKLRPAYFELLTYIQNHPNATMDELEGKAIDLIANPILDSMKTLKNEEAQEMLADIKKMRFS